MARFPALAFRYFVILATVSALADVVVGEAPIFANGEQPQLLLQQGAGEGPAWHPEYGLFFSGGGNINLLGKDGRSSPFLADARSNGLLLDYNGDLLICSPGYRGVKRLTFEPRKLTDLTHNYEGNPYNQPNDITVDSKGRIYFSDPRYGPRDDMRLLDAQGKKVEGVYRIDRDGTVTRVITHEVDRPNGLVVSADDAYLFVADNNNNQPGGARKLWRFELRSDGSLNLPSQKLLFDWKTGRGPDGMVLDSQGRIYVAGGLNEPNPPHETADEFKGGVYVFHPDGKLLDFVAIPRDEVTNCTFGGDDLKTLYITAGGTLWSIRTTTRGRMPWPKAAN